MSYNEVVTHLLCSLSCFSFILCDNIDLEIVCDMNQGRVIVITVQTISSFWLLLEEYRHSEHTTGLNHIVHISGKTESNHPKTKGLLPYS